MSKYKIEYTLKRHRGSFTTAPRSTFPSDEVRELENIHGSKIKTMTVLHDSEGADHPSNAGKFFLDRIIH